MNRPIYPCLWFEGNARAAADLYCSVFDGAAITEDTPVVVVVEAGTQRFMCLNGGPHFQFNPAISFFVACETEQEIDRIWSILIADGSVLMPLDQYDWSDKYGWVQDRFGVNWQLAYGKQVVVEHRFSAALMFTGDQHGKAEVAIRYYTSIFKDTRIAGILKYTANDSDVEGTVKHAQFKLGQSTFMAMDSSLAHQFAFNEAVSFVVECDNQQEVDYFWEKLTDGGQESMCGWLKDRFGVSWQIVPSILPKLLSDRHKAAQVTEAFMKMKKIDIEKLLKAYEQPA